MGLDDKARNKAQELRGQAKERVGEATDDEELQAEGKTDQTKADVKQAGEKVKDAFKR
ncbi:MAG TPA: CsbD family protein [Actinomycetes bacterium]|nr:CsbD family protein [Actinomycetes bacterium]